MIMFNITSTDNIKFLYDKLNSRASEIVGFIPLPLLSPMLVRKWLKFSFKWKDFF